MIAATDPSECLLSSSSDAVRIAFIICLTVIACTLIVTCAWYWKNKEPWAPPADTARLPDA